MAGPGGVACGECFAAGGPPDRCLRMGRRSWGRVLAMDNCTQPHPSASS